MSSNWVPDHRDSFIENRSNSDLAFFIHFDTTNLNKKSFQQTKGRAPVGKFPIVREHQNQQFNTATLYTASWSGAVAMEVSIMRR